MQRPIQLVALAEFPAPERAALQRVLEAGGIAAQHLCVSRLEPLEAGLAMVTIVSLPGWCRSYEGPDWLEALARDLACIASAPAARGHAVPAARA